MRNSEGTLPPAGTPTRLLAEPVAGDAGVPIHERAVRIVFPGPDVQCVERRKTEAVRALEVVKQLSSQHWRRGILAVNRLPGIGVDEEVDPGDLDCAVLRRLEQDDFRKVL